MMRLLTYEGFTTYTSWFLKKLIRKPRFTDLKRCSRFAVDLYKRIWTSALRTFLAWDLQSAQWSIFALWCTFSPQWIDNNNKSNPYDHRGKFTLLYKTVVLLSPLDSKFIRKECSTSKLPLFVCRPVYKTTFLKLHLIDLRFSAPEKRFNKCRWWTDGKHWKNCVFAAYVVATTYM